MDLLRELRENWRDSYWWLDHQWLRVLLLSVLSGMLGLAFVALEHTLRQRLAADV